MDNLFWNSNYFMVAKQIFIYLEFEDIKEMKKIKMNGKNVNYVHDIKYFTYEEAIESNSYVNVEYLTYHILFTPTDTSLDHIMAYAARYDKRQIMKLLYANGCWLSADTLMVAANVGNLYNMKWLKKIGCHMDSWTFTAAIINGNLENMKWLLEVGCPLLKDLIPTAMYHGNITTLQWLLDNGCPYGKNIIHDAKIYAKPHILHWLKEHIK